MTRKTVFLVFSYFQNSWSENKCSQLSVMSSFIQEATHFGAFSGTERGPPFSYNAPRRSRGALSLASSRSRPRVYARPPRSSAAVRGQCRPITPRWIAVLSTFLITKSNQTEAVAEAEAKAIAHSHFTLPYGVRVSEGTFLLK